MKFNLLSTVINCGTNKLKYVIKVTDGFVNMGELLLQTTNILLKTKQIDFKYGFLSNDFVIFINIQYRKTFQ